MAHDYLHAGETLWDFFGETMYSNILEEYYPRLLMHDQAQHIVLAGNSGKTIHVNAWDKVNPVVELTVSPNYFDTSGTATASQAAATTVEEHESPSSLAMTILEFQGTIQGFGGSFGFTDIHMSITEIVETLVAGARQLGGGYAQVVEDNAWKILLDALDLVDATTSNAQRAKIMGSNGKLGTSADPVIGTGSAIDYMRISDLFRITTEFDSDVNGEALRYPDGTVHGIIHPRVEHDLFSQIDSTQPNLVDWLSTTRGQGMYEGRKVPIVGGVLLDTSARNTTDPINSHDAFTGPTWDALWEVGTNNPWTNTTTDAGGYLCQFYVPGAWANIDLANATPSLILQPFGSGGAPMDSLKRFMTIGIKGYQTAIPMLMSTRAIFMACATTTTTT